MLACFINTAGLSKHGQNMWLPPDIAPHKNKETELVPQLFPHIFHTYSTHISTSRYATNIYTLMSTTISTQFSSYSIFTYASHTIAQIDPHICPPKFPTKNQQICPRAYAMRPKCHVLFSIFQLPTVSAYVPMGHRCLR